MSITPAGTAEIATGDQIQGHGHGQGSLAKLMVGAVGIVFGDIGTSPIYAFRETFAGHHQLVPDALHIYGVLSLIFWSMLIIVALKYVTIIMRADNKGEGGSLALLALINRTTAEGEKKKWTLGIVMLGVFATALFYGDSMITPAISVLSAVEGLTTVQAGFEPYVVPTAIGILVGLFAIQARGTAKVGLLFGPIMLVYFVTLAALGGMHIVKHPAVFAEMFNPWNAIEFYISEPLRAFIAMGSVVLAVTGAEALYADMGHFGRRPIKYSWLYFVMLGTILTGIGASAFLPLKYAIPKLMPFWLDGPLAAAERHLFGVNPWLLLDHMFWWAAIPLDRLYGCWLPLQLLVMAGTRARRGAGPRNCSASSAWSNASSTGRPNCRVASSSGSRLPVPLPIVRRWCLPTSQLAIWTKPPPTEYSPNSCHWSAAKAARPWSQPITNASPPRWIAW